MKYMLKRPFLLLSQDVSEGFFVVVITTSTGIQTAGKGY